MIRELEAREEVQYFVELVRSYFEDPIELERAEAILEQEIEEISENRDFYVLFDEGKALGGVQLILKNADNDRELADGGSVAHVHHLRVLKERQNEGIGTRLMEHLERESKKRGLSKLTLGVENTNSKAVAFYRRLGYSLMKESPGRFPEERLYYMQKDLCAEAAGKTKPPRL